MKNCNCHQPYSPEVSLHAKVQAAIDSIKLGHSGRVVTYCGPVTFVLSTAQAHFANLLYTSFCTQTGFPIESWQARYSNAHVIGQILFSPVPKIRLPYFVDCFIPGFEPICELPPTIIPGTYRGEYHYKPDEQHHHHHHHYHHQWIDPRKK